MVVFSTRPAAICIQVLLKYPSLTGSLQLANMPTIVDGVDFDVIAREWRCKWSADNDKKSLADAQAAMTAVLEKTKAVDGCMGVQRIVCGGCLDFKVITSLPADKYGAWEEAKQAPEEEFLAALNGIEGITAVETQTYTIMPM